eukprot:492588-Pelagomonas_calceolata.AAC.1
MNMLGVEEDTEKGVRRGPEEVAFECQTEDGSAEQSLITVTGMHRHGLMIVSWMITPSTIALIPVIAVEVRLKATSLLDPMDCGTLKEAVNRQVSTQGIGITGKKWFCSGICEQYTTGGELSAAHLNSVTDCWRMAAHTG